MKIFIWNNPYHVSYGGACAYVVAEDEAQAREILLREANISHYGGGPEAEPSSEMLKISAAGPPDRVYDAPYGEIYQWSE